MFFRCKKHAPAVMNKYGVVFVPHGHPAGATWWKGGEYTILERGNLDLHYAVEEEARQAGCTYRCIGNCEVLWSKPKPQPSGITG